MKFSDKQKAAVKSILEKIPNDQIAKQMAIVDFSQVYKALTAAETEMFDWVMGLKAKDIGWTGPFFGIDSVPNDLVTITGQKFLIKKSDGEEHQNIQQAKYLPKSSFGAYQKMSQKMETDIGRKLLVDSAYRSPAYQVLIYLTYLDFYKYSVPKVSTLVALPGYSEHGVASNPAIDFVTVDGVPEDGKGELFEQTPEFKWLAAKAGDFGLKLTYPRGNTHGAAYEPWHWRYFPTGKSDV